MIVFRTFVVAVLLIACTSTVTLARESDKYLIKCTQTTLMGPGMFLVTSVELFYNNCMATASELAKRHGNMQFAIWNYHACQSAEFPDLPATSLMQIRAHTNQVLDFQCGVELAPDQVDIDGPLSSFPLQYLLVFSCAFLSLCMGWMVGSMT